MEKDIKEYFLNSKIKFEGEYLNGKKWNGEAKEYYEHHQLKIERVYINGSQSAKV